MRAARERERGEAAVVLQRAVLKGDHGRGQRVARQLRRAAAVEEGDLADRRRREDVLEGEALRVVAQALPHVLPGYLLFEAVRDLKVRAAESEGAAQGVVLVELIVVVALLGWGLKKRRQSAESVGCHAETQDPPSSAFSTLPPLRSAGAPPLLSQHLSHARRTAPAVALPAVREGVVRAAGHSLLQLEDSRSGGLPLTRRHAARRHPDLDGQHAAPPA